MKNWRFTMVAVFVKISLSVAAVFGQVEKDAAIRFPVEMGTFGVKLTDMDGGPIVGAEVTVSGLRVAEDPGSWYSWPVKNGGTENVFATNEAGEVSFQYPKFVGVPPGYKTTTTLTFDFRHPEFVSDRAEALIADGILQAQLKTGCRVAFSAIDNERQTINAFGVCMAGSARSAMWRFDSGTMRSGAIPDGKWQTMLVAPRADGPTLFSGILPTRYSSGKDVTINNVMLSPGLRVRGRLSDNVPRPVADGIVVGWSQPKPTAEELEKRQAIGWSDSAIIAANGTFEFESLPRTGTLQLIAICRGWVCVDQPRENNPVPNSIKSGVLLDLSSSEIRDNELTDVVLAMEPAGVVQLTVKRLDGSPLAGANVSAWPNQMLERTGTNVLGTVYPTIDIIKSQIDPRYSAPNPWRDRQQSRYSQETDESGKATLYDIPLNFEYPIYVGNDHFQAVLNDAQPDRMPRIKLDSPETKKLEILVEPVQPSS